VPRRVAVVAGLAAWALLAVACDPRPFPPPSVESFVHTQEVPPLGTPVDNFDETTVTITGDDGLHHVLAVKVAHRPAELRQGLDGIADVPRGTGMLLLFPEDTSDGVSPADLAIALDHAFISGDGEVVAVLRIRPCVEGEPCVAVDPEVTYRAILQMPTGWLAEHRLERGATVEIGPIQPPSTEV